MKLSQFEYSLPKSLIANSPIEPRDHSKLMIVDRKTGSIRHKHFFDVSDMLTSRDVLVFNDTKVFPARLFGKKETGGKVEVLFLKSLGDNIWEILGKGIPRVGQKITFGSFYSKVINKGLHSAKVELSVNKNTFDKILSAEGHTPIPPYINTQLDEKALREKYQTKYAAKIGSVAAPTAGLHFTSDLLTKLRIIGVQMEFITLHVGLGTFMPVKTDALSKHKMHSEWFSLDNETALRLNAAKSAGKRIVAVGTTTTRVLESCTSNGSLVAKSGDTDIFIYPPYKFKFVDALITNFQTACQA